MFAGQASAHVGLLAGTVSLVGGHGTTIAWAPTIAERYGIANAMEISIACATMGLIPASLMGGPIARFLISRYQLQPAEAAPLDVGVSVDPKRDGIDHLDFLDAVLAIHVSVIVGLLLNDAVASVGLELPLFVTCLFGGIVLTNLWPTWIPHISGRAWPSRPPGHGAPSWRCVPVVPAPRQRTAPASPPSMLRATDVGGRDPGIRGCGRCAGGSSKTRSCSGRAIQATSRS